ncbi:adenylate/guanylate cyclase domain-containing protein [Mycobacterium sp. 1465703.0]|uniref:adenylate/guanylate cyclase domain-containing protein n=1 Tax=Mycobacterium sp. 1465703.0 TaxID=1834078 RepID=UPI0007FE02FA|nr:adenylate/guanylate cyclase domain-containing protein [Mycobacterium sp. 1465703.0]OBJ11036.1 cyclase [Mycobacterium sp. 1465703.0]
MDRIWQWAWDRHGARYSWAAWAIVFGPMLPVYLLLSFLVLAFEQSNHYAEAALITGVAVALNACVVIRPGSSLLRMAQMWAAGREVDRVKALQDTYTWTRAAGVRALAFEPVWTAVLLMVIGVVSGASRPRVFQYGILGAALGIAMALIGVHTSVQGALRPVRAALGGDTGLGDTLPRSRPTFATWINLSVLGSLFTFAVGGAMLAVLLRRASEVPVLFVAIGCFWTVLAVPITVGGIISPSLRPIRDLAEGTKRVAAGDYSQRLPVVQDDDLGALAASFNRMQAGLAERQRLQTAFGTYVDPALAARLLEQGDDVFTGERREVTVMFVDVRDFTPFAEANTAEDTVARLNALFEIVVPAVVDAGGHVNKFLGDGALAVFGAPNELADHADAALRAAVLIHRLVAERFDGALRIGIGVNTGLVIAGTIGGGGKLEFTLIGDAVNVAARVEQLTKTTGDPVLLTQQTVDALVSRPPGLAARGAHALKGKSAPTEVFGLDRADGTHG